MNKDNDIVIYMNIFDQSKQLLKGLFYEDIIEFPTFTYLKSVFSDKWYNLIEPSAAVESFDWEAARKLIADETKKGVAVSYYVHAEQFKSFEEPLKSEGYTNQIQDVFLSRETKQPSVSDIPSTITFALLEGQFFPTYVKMVKQCFPDYANNDSYCQLCYFAALENNVKGIGRKNINVILYDGSTPVSFGSLAFSSDVQLGYIHNTGTIPEARRKGYFSLLIQHLTAVAAKEGIPVIYANTERDSASYHGFIAGGFSENSAYILCSKT